MKGLDVLIVRFIPFVLFVIYVGSIIYCCFHDQIPHFYYLHGHSAIYASALFIISLANRRYHCSWNRAMYLFFIVLPIINYLEAKFNILPSDITSLYFVVIITSITIISTAYLAIRHFVQISKRRFESQLPRVPKTRGLKEAQVD